jgi:2-phospho-L-lactate guanylyltransferase
MLWAVVPVKELTQSKQRLAAVLDAGERERLVLAMLRDVLTAISGVQLLDGVLMVSRSQKVQALARDFVSDTFAESAGSDHSRAVIEANQYLLERYRAESSVAISADIPRITAGNIHRIIAKHRSVTLVPNAAGEGTNAVLSSPPNAIPCQFGKGSLRRHVASAEAAGISASIIPIDNMAHDIDDPRDLEKALADLAPSYTRDYLDKSGIADRLNRRHSGDPAKPARLASATEQWI